MNELLVSDERWNEFSEKLIFEDDISEEDDQGSLISTSVRLFKNFQSNKEKIVRNYIGMYFKEKQMHYGGSIPAEVLFSPYNISLVLNTSICDGVDFSYKYIESNGYVVKKITETDRLPSDVRLVLRSLHECACLNIPKQFIGGMILLNLELCEGIEGISIIRKANKGNKLC